MDDLDIVVTILDGVIFDIGGAMVYLNDKIIRK